MSLQKFFVAAALPLLGAAAVSHGSVVINGSFEAIDTLPNDAFAFSGENGTTITRLPTGGVGGSAGVLVSNVTPASAAGPFAQNTGVVGGDPLVGGQSYTFQFDSQRTFAVGGVFQALVFARDDGNNPIGAPVVNATLTSPTAGFETSTFDFTAPAGATRLSIEFFAITGAAPGSSSSVVLDNVAVVPEPAALAGLGLAGLALLRRRRA